MSARVGAPVDIDPSSYERWRQTDLGAITERLEHDLIIDMLPSLEGKRVLDVGCGDGALTEKLSHLGAVAVGVDTSSAMIAAAQTRKKGTFHVIDAMALPFPDGAFDVVTAVTVLCVCGEPDKMIKEMARVLRPGGRLLIGELGRWSLWALLRRIRALLGNRLWRQSRFFTQSQLTALVLDAGLQAQVFRGAVYYPPIGMAARLLVGADPALSRALGGAGAAFIVLSADKNAY
ncbi:MAG: class I SAM-dependent methyltransferase [Rhodospirillales bacterium]|nr:class I SAM-dependent methyltransferase [Rhodospirillales bacterium]